MLWDFVGATIDSIHTLVGSVILAALVLLLTVILLTLSGGALDIQKQRNESGNSKNEIHEVAIIGAGVLGSVVAGELAVCGVRVNLFDRSASRLQEVKAELHTKMAPLLQQEQITFVEVDRINSHIQIENEIAKSVASADLIIEMVPEKVQIKREVLQQVVEHCKPDAILASSTMSLNLDQITQGFSTDLQSRVCGCRFLYPAFLIDYVELTRSSSTSDRSHQRMLAFFHHIHKRCFPGPNSQRLCPAQVQTLQALSTRKRVVNKLRMGMVNMAAATADTVVDTARTAESIGSALVQLVRYTALAVVDAAKRVVGVEAKATTGVMSRVGLVGGSDNCFIPAEPRMDYFCADKNAYNVFDKLGPDELEVPHEYICPITQAVMVEPVIAPDGKNYEKGAIKRWLEKRQVSPLTNMAYEKSLSTGQVELVPNEKLQKEISGFVVKLEAQCL